jgi:5-methylcytosine-specific restriction endonuclease McrA
MRNDVHNSVTIWEWPALLQTARPMTPKGVASMPQQSTTSLIFNSKRRYCPKGHDTWDVGRYSDSHCRACNKTDSLRWQAENADHNRELARIRYHADPDAKRQAELRKRPGRAQWRVAHPEAVAAYQRNWKRSHPETAARLRLAAKQRRRALLRGNEHAPYDYRAVVFGAVRCGICREVYESEADRVLDHIIPITRGGGDIPENVQSAHRLCNARKGNRI